MFTEGPKWKIQNQNVVDQATVFQTKQFRCSWDCDSETDSVANTYNNQTDVQRTGKATAISIYPTTINIEATFQSGLGVPVEGIYSGHVNNMKSNLKKLVQFSFPVGVGL